MTDAYKNKSEAWLKKEYRKVIKGAWAIQPQDVYEVRDGQWRKIEKEHVAAPENCLTFSSAEPFTISMYYNRKSWDGALYYTTDGSTWSEWDGTTIIESAEHGGEQRVYMQGRGNSVISITSSAAGYRRFFVITGSEVSCNGNVETLLDYETVASGEHPTMADYCFHHLFADCTSLVAFPELPAVSLARYCYYGMFSGCTGLVTAPELPATTLADYCYYYMFENCTSLAIAPKLHATTLTKNCYYNMFRFCNALTSAPELPATTLAQNCYGAMFYGCKALTTAPELPATIMADYCYQHMFRECSELVEIPKLPATTLAAYCYQSMFNNCAKVKMSAAKTGDYQTPYRIPTSGTGTTATDALKDMFGGTGGTFTGTPTINTTYYTANEVV